MSFRTRADVEQATWIEDYVRDALDVIGASPHDGDGGVTIRRTAGGKRRPS